MSQLVEFRIKYGRCHEYWAPQLSCFQTTIDIKMIMKDIISTIKWDVNHDKMSNAMKQTASFFIDCDGDYLHEISPNVPFEYVYHMNAIRSKKEKVIIYIFFMRFNYKIIR